MCGSGKKTTVIRSFGSRFGQVGDDDVYPPRADQAPDSGMNLVGQIADRNPPPAADRDQHMIGGHPHPGYLPSWQVGHDTPPGTRAQIIDGRAVAGRCCDGVKVDAVGDSRRREAARSRDDAGHDTRAGASPSWPLLSGR